MAGAEHPLKLGFMAPLSEGVLLGKRTPTFLDVRAAANYAEQIGIDALWAADHLIARMPNEPVEGQWEALTFLSALAATTTHITLGPMVAATSFRNPALLAKMADSIDEISGGRFILGLGAGWHEPEYTAFGYPFDHLASRFEEALQIVVPLLREGHVDFAGQYYAVKDTVLRPRGPSARGPRILIGARKPRMLRLVARYADAWNTCWHTDAPVVAERWDEMRRACDEVGRDPATLELTVGVLVDMRTPDESGPNEKWINGSPQQIADRLRQIAQVGAGQLVAALQPEGVAGLERYDAVVELLRQR